MAKLKRHIFICTNSRPADNPKGSCAAKGSEALRDQMAGELAKRGLLKMMRANKAGCLDCCECGPVIVVYPEQVWYGNVTPSDIPEIVEKHLVNGEVVERLLIPSRMEDPT
jgi:(2Fe-2S) ferredoxin